MEREYRKELQKIIDDEMPEGLPAATINEVGLKAKQAALRGTNGKRLQYKKEIIP